MCSSDLTLADTGWVCTVNPGGTLGVTAVTWAQFSGAGTYTAGTGLTLSGTQFSITATGVTAASYGSASKTVTLAINAQGQITTASQQDIAIDASQVTTGLLDVARGGTGSSGFNGVVYASGSLQAYSAATGAEISSAIGSTAVQNATNATTATTATNATNVGVTANTSNSDLYIPLVTGSTSANYPLQVSSGPTINPSTGKITAGIAGGAF